MNNSETEAVVFAGSTVYYGDLRKYICSTCRTMFVVMADEDLDNFSDCPDFCPNCGRRIIKVKENWD